MYTIFFVNYCLKRCSLLSAVKVHWSNQNTQEKDLLIDFYKPFKNIITIMYEQVVCLLCLEDIAESADHIDIDSAEIESVTVTQILEKYFSELTDWITITSTRTICEPCWNAVENFHRYCLRVQHAHKVLAEIEPKTTRRKVQNATKKLESTVTNNASRSKRHLTPTPDRDISNKLTTAASTSNDNTYEYTIQIEPLFFNHESIEMDDVGVESSSPLPKPHNKRQRKKVLMKPSIKLKKATADIESIEISDDSIEKMEELLLPGLECNDSYIDECHIDALQDETSDENWIDSVFAMELVSRKGSLSDIETELNNLTDEQERHARTAHADDFINKHFQLNCNLCGSVATTFSKLHTHFRKQHKTDAYVLCCNKRLFNRTALIDHIHLHLNPECFKCPKCDKTLANSRYFRHHLKAHRESNKHIFKCKMCSEIFYTRSSLVRHEKEHMKKEKVPCPQCDSFFVSQKTLTRHLRTVHSKVHSKFCDKCGKVLHGRQVIKRHMDRHAGVQKQSVRCDICGIVLSNPLGLRRHMRGMHMAENLIPQTCPICLKELASVRAYKHHMHYMHELEPKHACTMCDKVFKRPSHLKEHMCSHTGQALYTCGFCPKMYTSDATLCIHRKKKHPVEWEESRRKRELMRGRRIDKPMQNESQDDESSKS